MCALNVCCYLLYFLFVVRARWKALFRAADRTEYGFVLILEAAQHSHLTKSVSAYSLLLAATAHYFLCCAYYTPPGPV